MSVIQKFFRCKKRIALGVLAAWMALFCLSFCDEMGFWVDAGKAADQAVEQMLAFPGATFSAVVDYTDHLKHVSAHDIPVSIYAISDTHSKSLTTFLQDDSQFFSRPLLFQVLSRLLI